MKKSNHANDGKFRFDLKDSALGFVDSLETLPKLERALADCVVLGIDTETKPQFEKRKSDHFLTHPTSIVQIALRSSRGAEEVLIVDMLPCLRDQAFKERLDELLCRVLQDKNIPKLGQALEGDLDELHVSYPSMRAFAQVHGIVEIFSLVRILQPEITQLVSLKTLVMQYFDLNLTKSQQRSDWSRRPLSAAQMHYAACDALVLLRLYDAMLCEIKELYAKRGKDFSVRSVAFSTDLTLSKTAKKRVRKSRGNSSSPLDATQPSSKRNHHEKVQHSRPTKAQKLSAAGQEETNTRGRVVVALEDSIISNT